MDIDPFGPVEHVGPAGHGPRRLQTQPPPDTQSHDRAGQESSRVDPASTLVQGSAAQDGNETVARQAASRPTSGTSPSDRPANASAGRPTGSRVPPVYEFIRPVATNTSHGPRRPTPCSIRRAPVHRDSFMSLRQLQQLTIERIMATAFVQAVHGQTIAHAQYRAYLIDVHHYARHNAQVIALAGSRLALSHPQLAEYLLAHASEEVSHDSWAHADLLELGLTDSEIARSTPSNPCLQMLGLEFLYAAHLNPLGFLGWLFVLRSVGSSFGGETVGALDRTLGLEGKGLAFLRSHASADAQHAEDLLGIIEQHISGEADRESFVRMMGLSSELYVGLLDAAFAAGAAGSRASPI